MKKSAIILMSLLLVLTIGQSAFAKGNVELNLGYNSFHNKYSNTNVANSGATFNTSEFSIDLSADYYIIKNLAIAGGIGVDFGSYKSSTTFDGITLGSPEGKIVALDFDLFAKYDIFNFKAGSIGLQAGIMDSMFKKDDAEKFSNAFMIALGVYGDVAVMPKLSLSTDAKFPIAFFVNNEDYSNSDGFFKLFLYDVDLKVTYDITPSVYAGLTFNVANTDTNAIESKILANDLINKTIQIINNYSAFDFTVGANVGYRF